MSSQGGQLPAHARFGRGSFAGPLIGGIQTLTFGPFDVDTAHAGLSNVDVIKFIFPFDFRVEEIGWRCRSAVADVDLLVTHDDGSTETALTSATLQIDGNLDERVNMESSTYTLVEAERNILQGEAIIFDFTTDGVDGEAVDLVLYISGFAYGHIHTDPAND